MQRPRRLHIFPPPPLDRPDGILLSEPLSAGSSSQLGDNGRDPIDS